MPRPRLPDRQKLPKYVYKARGWYVYREYLGVELGRPKFVPDRKLCRDDAPLSDVWAAYREVTTDTRRNSLAWLFREFLESSRYQELSRSSRDMYARNASQIQTTKITGGRQFGDVAIQSLSPGVFRRYMDKRAEDGAPVQANRELSFLKTAFAWAIERDLVKTNPVKPVRKFKENPRTRYVTDAEYAMVYRLAPPTIQAAMELAYLCRARKSEILRWKKSAIQKDGLLLERGKGSKTQLIGWTDRLRKAIKQADKVGGNVTAIEPYILHNKSGNHITVSGFNSAWQRLMRRAIENGLAERFTFHDLKAKGVSDFQGDKTKASGHKSARMTAIYDRKIETIISTR